MQKLLGSSTVFGYPLVVGKPGRTNLVHSAQAAFGSGWTPRDTPRLRAQGGRYGDLLRAIWGASDLDLDREIEARFGDQEYQQQVRPHVFVRKFHSRWRGNRLPTPDPSRSFLNAVDGEFRVPRASNKGCRALINETDFARVYSAAEYAFANGKILDTHVILKWAAMGVPNDDVQTHFLAFTKAARDFLSQRSLPYAAIYSHESDPDGVVHTHLILYLPPLQPGQPKPECARAVFREWAKKWPVKRFKRKLPGAIRVRGPMEGHPLLHWRHVSYLLKGYDPAVVVQRSRNTPDGQDVRLGDLIAWPMVPSGPVPLQERVGVSRSLDVSARSRGPFGHPGPRFVAFSVSGDTSTIPLDVNLLNKRMPFVSRYEGGYRDVRSLYPPDFYELVTKLTHPHSPPTASSEGSEPDPAGDARPDVLFNEASLEGDFFPGFSIDF